MNERDAAMLATWVTSCAAKDCPYTPVRMIAELPTDGAATIAADIVMLCPVHMKDYVPEGRVIHDQTIPRHLWLVDEQGRPQV